MKLLLNTHVDNEYFDGCCYAFLDLTPELAQLILKRRDALLSQASVLSGTLTVSTRLGDLTASKSEIFDGIELRWNGRLIAIVSAPPEHSIIRASVFSTDKPDPDVIPVFPGYGE